MRRALALVGLAPFALAMGAVMAGPALAWPEELVPSQPFALGSEVLEWGDEYGIPTLTHAGRIVARATNTYSIPFSVVDRWDDSQTHAVLLQAGVTATLDCSIFSVLENRKPGAVVSHALGPICVGMRAPTVERTAEGFLFSFVPTPTAPASARHWHARTGMVVTTTVEWHPAPGTTMASFVERRADDYVEPLETAEFFAAVSRLPKLERDRVLDALWQVAMGCSGCGGSASKDRYGVAIDDRTAAFSGCGWYMHGALVHCGPTDALAVWDRATGGFYFATDVHQSDSVHLDMQTLTVTPPVEQWPREARSRFETWRSGRPWPAIDR